MLLWFRLYNKCTERQVTTLENKDIFSFNLNYYMNENEKTRRDVADAIGVSYFTFTDWVKGKTYPRMDKVEKLAKYFGVKISDLVEKNDIANNPIKTAGLHARILSDIELMDTIQEYYELSASNQKMVRDLIHNLKKNED